MIATPLTIKTDDAMAVANMVASVDCVNETGKSTSRYQTISHKLVTKRWYVLPLLITALSSLISK